MKTALEAGPRRSTSESRIQLAHPCPRYAGALNWRSRILAGVFDESPPMNKPSQPRDQVILISILRMLGAVICLVLCGIMTFGFLASFEESGVTGWKIGYGASVLVFFLGFSVLLSRAIVGFQGSSR